MTLGFLYLFASAVYADLLVWLSPLIPANSVSLTGYRDACSSQTLNGQPLHGFPLLCFSSSYTIRNVIWNKTLVTPAPNGSNITVGYGNTMLDHLYMGPILNNTIKFPNGTEPASSSLVWTGCTVIGTFSSYNYSCNGFTTSTSSYLVLAGRTNERSNQWIESTAPNCQGTYYLYCYETAPPPSPVPTTLAPTVPTMSPTNYPTMLPTTGSPTTLSPTAVPTTAFPIAVPTTTFPTASPTTVSPSTVSPTKSPTTTSPTSSPTTTAPSVIPTTSPSTATPTKSPSTTNPTATPTSAAPSTTAPTSRGVVAAVLVWLSPPLSGPASLSAFAAACSNETVNGVNLRGTPLLCMSDRNVSDVLSGFRVVTPKAVPTQGNNASSSLSSLSYSDVALSGETMFSTTSFLWLLNPIKLANGSAARGVAPEAWTGCDTQGEISSNCNDFNTPYAYVSAGVAGASSQGWISSFRNNVPSCLGPDGPYRVHCSLDLPSLPPTPPPSPETVSEASSHNTNWLFFTTLASSLAFMY